MLTIFQSKRTRVNLFFKTKKILSSQPISIWFRFLFFGIFFHPPADLLDKWLVPYNKIDLNTEYALWQPNSRIDLFHMFVIAVGDPILTFSSVDHWIAMWSNYEWLWWIFIEVAEFHWCHTITWSRTYSMKYNHYLSSP